MADTDVVGHDSRRRLRRCAHPSEGPAHIRASFSSRTCSGLRPTMRDMAKRLAAHGFTVLVPNPFYRTTKAPGLSTDIDFANPADRAKIDALRAPLTGEAVMRDASAYVKFLDAQAAVDRKAKVGVFGYCMGRAYDPAGRCRQFGPNRARGRRSTAGAWSPAPPDSPHLLAAKMKALGTTLGVAMNDESAPAGGKNQAGRGLRGGRAACKNPGLRRLSARLGA